MSSVSSSQLHKFTVNTDYVVVVKLCIQLRSQRLLQILPTSSQLRLKTQAREYMLLCTVCRWIGYSSNAVRHLPSMLWCFGHRKEHPDCTSWVMRSWHGCLSWMRCRFFLHMVQPMLLPSQNPVTSCLIYISTGFTFLVLADPGSPGKSGS